MSYQDSEDFTSIDSWGGAPHDGRKPAFKRWPALVGMDLDRAAAIVRWESPYYVVVKPFKKTRTCIRPLLFDGNGNVSEDAYRVVLWADPDGYVALTPIVG